MFKRYTLTDVTSNQFYQMPKFLFEGELKSSLSNDAKVLYSLLRDRHDLSIANRWIDKNGDVYLIYTRVAMCEILGCSKQKIVKLCNELKEHNLFEEMRQGLNKPNLIYLNYLEFEINNPNTKQEPMPQEDINEKSKEKDQQTPPNKEVPKSYFQKYENHTLRSQEIRPQEVPKSDPNNTNPTQTDSSHTDYQSIYLQEQENDEMIEKIDNFEEVIEIVKENIEYDLCKQAQSEKEYIDNILSVMVEVICSTFPTVRVNGQDKAQPTVKSQFLKLTYEHIEYVCLCLSENTSKIKNIRSYLITALYNAPQTMDTYYSQRVKHDLKEC